MSEKPFEIRNVNFLFFKKRNNFIQHKIDFNSPDVSSQYQARILYSSECTCPSPRSTWESRSALLAFYSISELAKFFNLEQKLINTLFRWVLAAQNGYIRKRLGVLHRCQNPGQILRGSSHLQKDIVRSFARLFQR